MRKPVYPEQHIEKHVRYTNSLEDKFENKYLQQGIFKQMCLIH